MWLEANANGLPVGLVHRHRQRYRLYTAAWQDAEWRTRADARACQTRQQTMRGHGSPQVGAPCACRERERAHGATAVRTVGQETRDQGKHESLSDAQPHRRAGWRLHTNSPVGRQRCFGITEHAAAVEGMVLGGVKVRVVADGYRQKQLDIRLQGTDGRWRRPSGCVRIMGG